MNTLILLFIGLFAVSALIITSVVINKRKRRREAEADEQRRKAELEALEHKLKAMEDKIAAQTRELEDREDTLKKETEALIREREDVATIRKQLNTEAERIEEERAILDATVQEHLTKEKQLQDIVAEQKVKYEQLAALEENLKRTSEELTEKDLKLAALKEEIEGLAAVLMKEKEELDSRDSELETLQDKLKSEREEMEHKIIEEKKNLAEERATALKSARESLDKIVLLEAELEARAYDLKALEDNIAAQKEEIEVRAAALIKEKEEQDARDAGLKALQDKLKPERDKLEQWANELREFHERLTSKEKSLYSHESKLKILEDDLQKKREVVIKLLTKLSGERENIENEKRSLEEKSDEIARGKSALIECDRSLKSKEEETCRETQEEQERKADDESQEKAEKGPLPPDKKGGRPRGLTDRIDQERETKPRSLRPEIVCWKEGWSWVIGIEVPEELESLRVTQNEELLEQDNIDESRYRLKQADGIVKFTWTEGDKVLSLMESKRNYLIFKMRKNWKEPGRLVQRSTIGYYLIVAPQEWERDKEISGIAPVNPERTQLEGYKAHFFYKEQKWNNAIGFITANGERIRVESGSPRFQLVGNEINDASEDMGPLFGGPPPLIQTLDGKGWSDVGVIVVGEEGRGRNRWRTQFVPQVDVKEQKLTEELTHRHGGWYFVRIYNNDGNLLESMDFRFLTSLNDVCIENSNFLPDQNGYDNVTVRFLHQTDCKVELINKDTHHTLEIQIENGQTIVIIPPKLDCDKTHWILRNGNAEIEVTVLIERIWWALGMLGMIPTDWVDKPINLSCKDFTAITERALWLRFPRPLFTRRIDVGFDRSKIRSYQVEVEKKDLAIPLRDFCDAEEIQNPRHECFFQLFIDSQDKTYSAPLLQVPISFHCKNCKFVTNSEQEARSHLVDHLSDLIPHLRYEELRQIFGESLPHTIYKCSYCNYYISSHDPRNPTSTICSHIEDECQKAVRENGIIKKRFSVVSDVNEIRENVITNLPRIFRCRVCSKEFQGDNIELRTIHLQEKHKKELFEIL